MTPGRWCLSRISRSLTRRALGGSMETTRGRVGGHVAGHVAGHVKVCGSRPGVSWNPLVSRVCVRSFRSFRSLGSLESFAVRGGNRSPLPLSLHVAPSSLSRTISSTRALAAEDSTYDSSQIQVLQGLDPVRKRPGMYIGSTGQRGLHHLIYEILDNSIDEIQGGYATHVYVDMDLESNVITIRDDGRCVSSSLVRA